MKHRFCPLAVALAASWSLGCASTDRSESTPADPQLHATRGTLSPPPVGTPGDLSLSGQVVLFPDEAATDAGLCVTLMDPSDRALDGEATEVTSTTSTSGGAYTFSALPTPPTVGWVLVVDDCGDTRTWVPTGTLLPGDQVGGRGRSEPLSGVRAWLVSTAERDRIDEGLVESGSGSILGDGGGLIGRSLDSSGAPNNESWVRGPNATQLWYPQSDGTYTLYDNTDEAAGGIYVAPDAEDVFGVFVTRVSGAQFQPLMAGGLPGVIEVWDFVAWEPEVARAL